MYSGSALSESVKAASGKEVRNDFVIGVNRIQFAFLPASQLLLMNPGLRYVVLTCPETGPSAFALGATA
jgi:hypothetical protein